MPATVKDIARQLNISTSTVCYALNGGPRTVNEETRKRVLELAEALDYRPNRVARSLAMRTSGTIGVVPPSTEPNIFQSPFVLDVWNAIVNEAEEMGLDILLFAGRNLNTRNEPGRGLLDGRVDGVVFIAPTIGMRALPTLTERQFPAASISSAPDAPGPHYCADNAHGSSLAVRHLAELGHRRIAHIAGHMDSSDAALRCEGFCETMSELGLPVQPGLVVEGRFTRDSGYQAARRLLSLAQPPTAIVAANDETAYGAMIAARELGVDIPGRLSVVGFDDFQPAAMLVPPLTTVKQPVVQMAQAAMQAVTALIEGEEAPPSRQFATRLIVRESTARPA